MEIQTFSKVGKGAQYKQYKQHSIAKGKTTEQ